MKAIWLLVYYLGGIAASLFGAYALGGWPLFLIILGGIGIFSAGVEMIIMGQKRP